MGGEVLHERLNLINIEVKESNLWTKTIRYELIENLNEIIQEYAF